MYKAESGEVFCDRCGSLIGNINGDGNFYALIRAKYCSVCRESANKESHRLAQQAFRRRKKLEKKAVETKIELLTQENELLRKRIAELRSI